MTLDEPTSCITFDGTSNTITLTATTLSFSDYLESYIKHDIQQNREEFWVETDMNSLNLNTKTWCSTSTFTVIPSTMAN